jgi:N6-adenosine-specific RNA methylase IME4
MALFSPFPNKKYKIIYADCPWKYNDRLDLQGEGADLHYPTLSVEELKQLKIDSISDKDCILFFWVTMPMLKEGLEVINSWGFKYKTCAFCWIKTNPKANTIFKGIGRWVMGNAELCLLATKGKPKRITKNISQVIMAHRTRHSQKPHEARERIVKLMGDLPRIELFAREKIKGWDCWGNQISKETQEKI